MKETPVHHPNQRREQKRIKTAKQTKIVRMEKS